MTSTKCECDSKGATCTLLSFEKIEISQTKTVTCGTLLGGWYAPHVIIKMSSTGALAVTLLTWMYQSWLFGRRKSRKRTGHATWSLRQRTILQTVYWNILNINVALLFCYKWPSQVVILYKTRQLRCRDLCKDLIWSESFLHEINTYFFARFGLRAQKSFVQRIPVPKEVGLTRWMIHGER